MEQVLTKALAFVAVIALGYFLKKRGFFKPHDYELIAKIVLNITLPCAVITSFASFKMDYTLFILTLIGFCLDTTNRRKRRKRFRGGIKRANGENIPPAAGHQTNLR